MKVIKRKKKHGVGGAGAEISHSTLDNQKVFWACRDTLAPVGGCSRLHAEAAGHLEVQDAQGV